MPGKSITSSSGKIGMVSGSAVCASAAGGLAIMPATNHTTPTTNLELRMRKVAMTLLTFALGAGFAVLFLDGNSVEGQAQPAAAGGFSAVPNAVGTQDVTGPYEVVKGWPKDISTLAGNEKGPSGAGEAFSPKPPNPFSALYRAGRPNTNPPKPAPLPQVG